MTIPAHPREGLSWDHRLLGPAAGLCRCQTPPPRLLWFASEGPCSYYLRREPVLAPVSQAGASWLQLGRSWDTFVASGGNRKWAGQLRGPWSRTTCGRANVLIQGRSARPCSSQNHVTVRESQRCPVILRRPHCAAANEALTWLPVLCSVLLRALAPSRRLLIPGWAAVNGVSVGGSRLCQRGARR